MYMQNQESTEMYLETIFVLGNDGRKIHAIDIAKKMGFSKPSVSIAMKKLKDAELIKTDKDGSITLTKNGMEIAERTYERHIWISEWLIGLGVNRETAVEDACRLEHVISAETFEAMKKCIQCKYKEEL